MATITGDQGISQMLGQLAKQLELDATTVYRKTVIDVFAKVVQKTPVKTGRARASWRIGVGSPDLSVAPEGGGGSPIAPPPNAISLKATWITNNLPYIAALEEGWSGQAPNGMLRISLLEVRADLASLL